MKILLLGAKGQVGWELQRSLFYIGETKVCSREEIDIKNFEAISKTLEVFPADIIVNATAYTAVDKAEEEKEEAFIVNAEAVSHLGQEAKKHNSLLVHYSTDYVFDGKKPSPYLEEDSYKPLGVYGQSKAKGEEEIRKSKCQHLIFRTSWVYGRHGHNFIKTMLKIGKEREELKVVSDQIGSPTSAECIADITSLVLSRLKQDKSLASQISGTYHLCSQGYTSWHGLAQHIFQYALEQGYPLKIRPEKVEAIATSQYPTPAKRPLNSHLDTKKFTKTFDLKLPNWESQVERTIYKSF